MAIYSAITVEGKLTLSNHTYVEHHTGGLDYGPFPVAEVNVTHTIPAASSESLFGIQIREDTIVEETETFSVEIFLAPNQPGVMIGAVNRATVFINDNDDRESCSVRISIVCKIDQYTYSLHVGLSITVYWIQCSMSF